MITIKDIEDLYQEIEDSGAIGEGCIVFDSFVYYTDSGYALEGMRILIEIIKDRFG